MLNLFFYFQNFLNESNQTLAQWFGLHKTDNLGNYLAVSWYLLYCGKRTGTIHCMYCRDLWFCWYCLGHGPWSRIDKGSNEKASGEVTPSHGVVFPFVERCHAESGHQTSRTIPLEPLFLQVRNRGSIDYLFIELLEKRLFFVWVNDGNKTSVRLGLCVDTLTILQLFCICFKCTVLLQLSKLNGYFLVSKLEL